jgi:hypothetical protein
MTEPEHNHTNQPKDGAKIEPIGYLLGVQFHSPIKLIHKTGLEFAAKLSGVIDSRGLDLQETRWQFTQPFGSHAHGVFRVNIDQSTLTMEASYPSDRRQLIEDRFGLILKEFQNAFQPELILGSSACFRGTLSIDGDSRAFLGSCVANIPDERMAKLGRPLHLFGIRVFLPPFVAQEPPKNKKGKQGKRKASHDVRWGINVRAESLMEDTTKMFIEGSGEWPEPRKWDESASKDVIQHLDTVSEYLSNKFLSFLVQDGA